MKYFLIISYTLLFSFFLYKWKFARNSQLNIKVLYIFLGLKILFAALYAHILIINYGGGDPYYVFRGGNIIHRSFFENPMYYFRLVFGPNGGYIDVPIYKYAYQIGYWDHAGFYNIARFHALLRPLSFGYYSVHVLFMGFLMFIAGLHYYNLFARLYPNQRLPILITIFMLPSLLFWTGGIHKDGFVYLGIGIALYHVYELGRKFELRNLLFLLVGISIVIMVRDYLAVLLLPPLLLVYLTLRYPRKVLLKFGIVYLVGFFILLASNLIAPINPFEILANKQASFLMETGGSDFNFEPMEPSASGFLQTLPSAVYTGFFRPLKFGLASPLIFAASIGVLFFWLLWLTTVIFRRRDFYWHPVVCFLLFYGLSNILMVGLLLSNEGTLVRYRSVGMNLLILVAAVLIDWSKITSFLRKRSNE